jgi:mycothiol S-conjugate amidase
VNPADVPLRLLCVHAHPDDEASKGASMVAMYRAEGIGATLVCCTGGELGEVLNPAMDRPEILADLAAVRLAELEASVGIIGYDRWDMLGYRDSGMPDMAENSDPANFANAPEEEATERLVRIIRRDRPQVIVTYSDDQGGYPHPDHIRTHEISVLAFERAGSHDWYPDSGEPWAPSKLYYSIWSKARVLATHHKMLELGIESPYTQEWFDRFDQDHRITTRIDVSSTFDVRERALLAHATQVDPASLFWFGLPTEIAREVFPYDEYILAHSLVETTYPEVDLFAGLAGR